MHSYAYTAHHLIACSVEHGQAQVCSLVEHNWAQLDSPGKLDKCFLIMPSPDISDPGIVKLGRVRVCESHLKSTINITRSVHPPYTESHTMVKVR